MMNDERKPLDWPWRVEQAISSLDLLLADLVGHHEVKETIPGVYMHTFTPPEMTMEDVARLLNNIQSEHKEGDTTQ